MRHGRALRKLGRTTSHRMALLRNLSTSFFAKERIQTTLIKAKELRPFAERLITLARRDDLASRRRVAAVIADREVVKKLFSTLGPRFAQRPGGYSRILKLGWRSGDGAEMALIELLGSEPVFEKSAGKGKAGRKGRKKKAAAGAAPEEAAPPGGTAGRKGALEPASGKASKKRTAGVKKEAGSSEAGEKQKPGK